MSLNYSNKLKPITSIKGQQLKLLSIDKNNSDNSAVTVDINYILGQSVYDDTNNTLISSTSYISSNELIDYIYNNKSGILGSQGDIGLTGAQGDRGTQGIKGLQGFPGMQGSKGAKGEVGMQGPQGTSGVDAVGNKGPTGPQGLQGYRGMQGAIGYAQAVQDASEIIKPNIPITITKTYTMGSYSQSVKFNLSGRTLKIFPTSTSTKLIVRHPSITSKKFTQSEEN